jgi:hypothetical protein
MSLQKKIEQLSLQLAQSIIKTLRTASLDELVGLSGVSVQPAPTRRRRRRVKKKKALVTVSNDASSGTPSPPAPSSSTSNTKSVDLPLSSHPSDVRASLASSSVGQLVNGRGQAS